ncbi:MAG: hypothetical protein U5J83_00640 [Bryobacterales bacterium]|nr:hypothetical protein [Bryobacterales bacterium]
MRPHPDTIRSPNPSFIVKVLLPTLVIFLAAGMPGSNQALAQTSDPTRRGRVAHGGP